MERNEKIVMLATGFIVGASTTVFAIAKIRKNRAEKKLADQTDITADTTTPTA